MFMSYVNRIGRNNHTEARLPITVSLSDGARNWPEMRKMILVRLIGCGSVIQDATKSWNSIACYQLRLLHFFYVSAVGLISVPLESALTL